MISLCMGDSGTAIKEVLIELGNVHPIKVEDMVMKNSVNGDTHGAQVSIGANDKVCETVHVIKNGTTSMTARLWSKYVATVFYGEMIKATTMNSAECLVDSFTKSPNEETEEEVVDTMETFILDCNAIANGGNSSAGRVSQDRKYEEPGCMHMLVHTYVSNPDVGMLKK